MFRLAKKILIISMLVVALPVFAQDYVPLAPLPGAAPREGTTLSTYLPGLFTLFIGVTAALAVIMIIVGGLQYMTTDAYTGKSEAKSRITSALLGLGLALGAFLILQTINPDLVNLDLATQTITVRTEDAAESCTQQRQSASDFCRSNRGSGPVSDEDCIQPKPSPSHVCCAPAINFELPPLITVCE